jgi:SAM-dependent methyltransferase
MNHKIVFPTGTIKDEIDAQIASEGTKPKPVKPMEAPVLAQAHTPIYRMHRYYARRPHNVFNKLVEHYSDPGDLILDPFCGGGVTVVESLRRRRRVVGVDLNPLATWVTKIEVERVDLEALQKLFDTWIEAVEKQINPFFGVECPECKKAASAAWYEWSNVVVCPNCENDIVLGKARKIRAGQFECQDRACRTLVEPSKCTWKEDRLLGVVVRCQHCEALTRRDALPIDEKKYRSICRSEAEFIKKHKLKIPSDKFPDMDRARDDNIFGKGITHFRDFMTARQRIACGLMKKLIPDDVSRPREIDSLRHVFSATLRFTNKFVFRSATWQSGNPIEWAGHNYWLPFSYIELNPISPLRRRFKALIGGKEEQQRDIGGFAVFPHSDKPWTELADGATCWLLNQSSHSIKLPDSSVDAIITDPPFGGNVQYGELSDFYLVWVREFLGIPNLSDKKQEAIETRHQGFENAKDRSFYEDMLFRIFKECRRVIKPDGWMVMTFHNRDIGVWMSLHRAALRAGFRLPLETESVNRGMVYQPPVQNYTQTIHQRAAGSMLGDFILSFKPAEAPTQLEAIKSSLSVEEEKGLQSHAEDIIRYHGGADETTLMTGLIPYLHEKALLHRLAKYDLKILLENGPFVYAPKEKRWYMKDMIGDEGKIRLSEAIPAENMVQKYVHSFLSDRKQATMDELIVLIYSILVNSHRPQISTIDKVLNKYCKRRKIKGEKRDVFVWNPAVRTDEEISKIKGQQITLGLDAITTYDHNEIILSVARMSIQAGHQTHAGVTEQKKDSRLADISSPLSEHDLGISPRAFRIIKEIDLLILKEATILAAVEVTTTISTINKAINDRFRNLLTVAPNLSIALAVLVKRSDFQQAYGELWSPANVKSGLSKKIRLISIEDITAETGLDKIMGSSLT